MSITILILTTLVAIVVGDVPTYKCSSSIRSQCILKNIKVTRKNYNFQVTADNPSDITQVIISNSHIPIFGGDICGAFPNLAHLEIQAAEIDEIHKDAFKKCTNLASLKIVNQHIEHLDKDVFKPLAKLDVLALNNIGLRELHVDAFANLTQLFSLSLSGNHLYEFPVEILKSLSLVDQLWLNANELSDIDEHGIVNALPRLTELYINDNDFNCHRIATILRVFKENEVKGMAKTVERKRYYTPKVIDKIQCLTEEQWTHVHYAKVGQEMMRELKDLKNVVENLKKKF